MGEVGLLLGLWVKLHLVCSTNRVPISYELTAANVAHLPGEDLARKLVGDLAYRSGDLEKELAQTGVVLVSEHSAQGGKRRQQAEIAVSSLKRVFGIDRTLAKTLIGLATRIVAKVAAYTSSPSTSTGC